MAFLGEIARKLEFEIGDRTQPANRPLILTNQVFPGGSLAIGVLPQSRLCKLICVTQMKANLFWEHIEDKLGLKGLSRNAKSQIVDLSDVEDLDQAASGFKVLFVHSQNTWSSFDSCTAGTGGCRELADYFAERQIFRDALATLSKHPRPWHNSLSHEEGTPSFLSNSVCRDDVLLSEDALGLDAVTLSDAMNDFRRAFTRIRSWASSMGLLSDTPDIGLLSEECLVVLFARSLAESQMSDAVFQTPTFSKIANEVRIESAWLPSGIDLAETVHADHALAISRAILAHTTSPAWLFLKNETFYKHDVCCWDQETSQNLDVLKGVYEHASKLRALGQVVRIWPTSFKDTPGEHLYLLGASSTNSMRFPTAQELDHADDRWSRTVSRIDKIEVATLFSMQAKKTEATHADGEGQEVIETSRFRSASKVMSRLQHDAKHKFTQYEVGYKDRFEKKLMWKALEKWEKHTEEEEFVPEHRIQKIRRKIDGVVVWDRQTKVDRS